MNSPVFNRHLYKRKIFQIPPPAQMLDLYTYTYIFSLPMRIITLSVLLLYGSQIYGQKTFRKLELIPPSKTNYSKEVMAIEKQNHKCVRINVKSFSQRIKSYPYNKAAQIQFVSFECCGIPVSSDTVCCSRLKELKNLTLMQIESLTDILYNVGFGGTILKIEKLACYNPRNAILFLDTSGKVFEYIELCFECEQFEVSSEKIKFGDICNEKFSLLKRQFVHAGIKYGTKYQE